MPRGEARDDADGEKKKKKKGGQRRVVPTSRQVLRSYRCYRNPRKRRAGLYCQRVYLSGENVRRSAYIATKGPLFESSLDVTLQVDFS